MKRSTAIPLFVTAFVISFCMISCKHETPGFIDAGPPTQDSSCSPDSVYFVNEIQPLINSSCATTGCHDAATHREGIVLTSYSNIRTYAKLFNGAGSDLYKVLIASGEKRMPPAGPLPAAQVAKILKWINQGAANNQCTGSCDSTAFTYSATVSVTINTFCKGCHYPALLSGGIDLSTYAAVKAQALNGRLMGSITHSAGFIAMPQGGSKLSDCQISQLKKWIQAGTLNN